MREKVEIQVTAETFSKLAIEPPETVLDNNWNDDKFWIGPGSFCARE